MKTLYESILDDEDVLTDRLKESTKNWFIILKTMISEYPDEKQDIINMLKNNETFQKDIMSVFKDKSNIEIKAIVWKSYERYIGVFHKDQQLFLPDIEFAYCKDKSIYGNTNFVMKFNNYHMLNLNTQRNIKSKQAWSSIPSKLCKKYKLKTKRSPYIIGEIYIYQ